MRATVRASALALWVAAVVGGPLSGCKDAEVTTSTTNVNVAIGACLGEVGDVAPNSCRATLNASIADTAVNACLVVSKDSDAGPSATFRRGLKWADGVLSPVGGDLIDVGPGERFRMSMFLLSTGGGNPAVCNSFDIESACGEGCILRLDDSGVLSDGANLDFKNREGVCNTTWSEAALPDEVCDGVDNDCDGLVDAEDNVDGRPIQCGSSCIDDSDCGAGDNAGLPLCVDGTCQACAPTAADGHEAHQGCAANELCCGVVPTCQPTDPANQCAGCGVACGGDSADTCVDRQCVCGDTGGACTGDADLCIGGACVQCNVANNVGEGPEPDANPACAAGELCCNNQCVPQAQDRCGTCDEGCSLANNRCDRGVCRCGGTANCEGVCDEVSDDPTEALCRECQADGNCGNPAEPFCVNQVCQACDENATEATMNRTCAEAGDTPICQAGECVACSNSAQCDLRPGRLDFCVGGRCRQCEPGSNSGCSEAEPICDNGTCRPCARDNECPGEAATCVQGQCRGCNPMTHDGCGTPPERPFCDQVTLICRGCGSNNECMLATGGEDPICIREEGRCRVCNPDTHEGCGLNSLCCPDADGTPRCVPTDFDNGCAGCGVACDGDYADACVDRQCVCGPSGRGCTPDDGEIRGERCSDQLGCVECRDNGDCSDDFQCCDGSCQPTGGGVNDICTGCAVGGNSCNQATTDRCTGRQCVCGAVGECNGDTPVCDDDAAACVQCLVDQDCVANGFPGRQCVAQRCRECDENPVGGQPAHIGCDIDGPRPICDAGDCQPCATDGNRNIIGDAQCALRPGGRTQCVEGQCTSCDPGTNDGCEAGAPICDDGSRTCRQCVLDNECPAGQLCVGGQCDACNPADSANTCGGTSPVCDANNRRCRSCSNDADCSGAGLAGICTPDGRCVECDLSNHRGCNNSELCCGPVGDQSCTPATMAQCGSCGVPCDGDATNRCVNRVCECGNHNPSICAGFEPYCAGNGNSGECVACRDDDECVLPGRSECVATGDGREAFCEVCDPNDNTGCNVRSNQPFCKRNGDIVACSACAGDAECNGHPVGGQCVASGACKACDPADDSGCLPNSGTPICGNDFACRVCNNDVECGANDRAGDLCHIDTGRCYACDDGRRTGDETAADCGGRCARDFDQLCADNQGCALGTDCQSGVCANNLCSPPACDDGVLNGTETDVDCGGDTCGPCGTALRCDNNSDCQSSNCQGGRCAAPTCDDDIRNQDESDVDCGGDRCGPCANGRQCAGENTNCVSQVCGGNNRCAAPTCNDGVLNGNETDTDCGGPTCPACNNNEACQADRDCTSQVCRNQLCQAPTCNDLRQNQNETDVDCGGPCRALGKLCAGGEGCNIGPDCITGTCDNGTCNADSCGNGVFDEPAGETDVDCGGPCGSNCQPNDRCLQLTDCETLVCTNNVCQAATCNDGVKNGDETDTDCGGGGPNNCTRCNPGQACADGPRDCSSFICDNDNLCTAPTCNDGVRNQAETGVDCSGECPTLCPPGQGCANNGDCAEGVCGPDDLCAAPTCADGTQNQQETDVDCGGPACRGANPCPVGDSCLIGADCAEGVCDGGTCAAATCNDGVRNGSETDTDCGGDTCDPCATGQSCAAPGDCESSVCTGNLCQAPACNDGVSNGTETGIDCGGPDCPSCVDGQACNANEDCQSSVCTGLICQSPTCADGVENGNETDTDCGGAQCRTQDLLCVAGQTCAVPADCVSGVCNNNQCAAAACDDGVKNGDETGIDCGGSCPDLCPAGQGCNDNDECLSSVCTNNLCQAPTCNDNVHNGTESDVDCGGTCNGCGRGEQCGNAADCANNVSHCVGGTCQACDPTDHSGCNNSRLCCLGGGGVNYNCQGTDPNDQCAVCDVPCNPDRADSCGQRSCQCGNDPECDDSYCLGGVCGAECLRDEHCAGNDNGIVCGAGNAGECGCEDNDDCAGALNCVGNTCQ